MPAPSNPQLAVLRQWQCVEKYLKAVLVDRGIPFAKTHDIEVLMTLIPPPYRPSMTPTKQRLFTSYAVVVRYPQAGLKIPIRESRSAVANRITGELAYTCGGKRVEFQYDVVRMWQQPVEPFLHGGVGLLPLATLCRMPDEKPLAEALREVVREIDRRLIQECEHPQAVR